MQLHVISHSSQSVWSLCLWLRPQSTVNNHRSWSLSSCIHAVPLLAFCVLARWLLRSCQSTQGQSGSNQGSRAFLFRFALRPESSCGKLFHLVTAVPCLQSTILTSCKPMSNISLLDMSCNLTVAYVCQRLQARGCGLIFMGPCRMLSCFMGHCKAMPPFLFQPQAEFAVQHRASKVVAFVLFCLSLLLQ